MDNEINLQRQLMNTLLMYRKYNIITDVLHFFTNLFQNLKKKPLFQSWIKIDLLDVTCFIISLFTGQHVSNVSTSIFRSLRLIVAALQPA